MSKPRRVKAAKGDLASFEREHFEHDGFAHDVYRGVDPNDVSSIKCEPQKSRNRTPSAPR